MSEILISLISGLVGGNAAGALAKKFSLGPIVNSIVGLLGGLGGGQLLGLGSTDTTSMAGNIAASLGGGGILTAIVGFIKSKLAK